MWRTRLIRAAVLTSIVLAAAPTIGHGQIGALRRKAEEEAKKKLEASGKKPDSAKAKMDSAKAKADTAKSPPTAKSAPTAGKTTAVQPPASAKVWENYDFVPGNKVLFYTDFSEDRVGNFARGLKYLNGPMEIVERGDVKMLRATGPGELHPASRRCHAGDDVLTAANADGRPRTRGRRQITRSKR
jgi:hypothetical protein